jgi:predicted metal-dependent hydrolase
MGIRSIRKTDKRNRPQPPMITQDMLFELLRLRAKNKRLDELRTEIHALLEDGAEIERGSLDLAVRISNQKRLTERFLINQLGKEAVEELKELVEPTVFRRLIVVERRRK